jgi:hypothetical protein
MKYIIIKYYYMNTCIDNTNNNYLNTLNNIIKNMFIILLPFLLLFGMIIKLLEYILYLFKLFFIEKIKNEYENDFIEKNNPLENI